MEQYTTSSDQNDTEEIDAVDTQSTDKAEVELPVVMRWYPYGHDFGNAEIGGTMIKGDKVISRSMPTAFAQMSMSVMRNMGIDMSEASIIQIQGETTSFGIGSVALAHSTDAWHGRGYIKRYASRYSLRALLAMSGSMIPDKDYGLMVVGGLPAETYQKDPELRKEIKKALAGKHTFTLDGGITWRTCTVEYAATLMEGAGALIAYGATSESAQGSAILDIGGRTTDLYVARQQVPVINFCTGFPVGVESATKMVVDAFEETHNVSLSALEARAIMHAYAASLAQAEAAEAGKATAPAATTGARGKKKGANLSTVGYPDISVNGISIQASEIEGIVKEAIDVTAGNIIANVASAWRSSDRDAGIASRFKPVMMIGGGVYYFFSAIKQNIPHLIRPAGDPVHSNALGYAKAAATLLEKRAAKRKA